MNPIDLTIKLNPAKEDPLDFRDYDARKLMGAPEKKPRIYFATEDMDLKVEDQGHSGSCVAQAFSKYAEVLNWYDIGQKTDLSARFIYSQIHLPQGGAYLRRGAKLVKEEGDALEKLCSSYPATEKHMRKEPKQEAIDNAMTYKAKSYAKDWNKDDINFMARMIYENKGFVTGAKISHAGWKNAHVRPPKENEDTGGHAFYCYGYNLDKGRIYFVNSWGKEDWGNQGIGYFTEDYIDSGKLFNIWTLVDKPNIMDILNQKLNKEAIKKLYRVIHRREASESALDYWEGENFREFLKEVKESKEFKKYSDVFETVKAIENWAKTRNLSTSQNETWHFKTDTTGEIFFRDQE